MPLIPDAKRVVLLSYSFWASVLGLLALIVPEFAFYQWGVDFDPYILWWIGVGLMLFSLVGRLIVQTGGVLVNALRIAAVAGLIFLLAVVAGQARPAPSVTYAIASEAETLAIAVPLVARFEGLRLEAYIPIPGDVPTICYGTTRGVVMGMRRTLAQCNALLRAEVAEYRAGLHRYFTPVTIRDRLPPRRDAAFTSLAYNIGITAAGGSTATRRLNAGDVPGACEAITWFNRAGQRVIRGLVHRRAEERALCLEGVG